MQYFLIVFLFIGIYPAFGQEELQRYFDEAGVSGSTTIYDYLQDKWIYTDSLDAQLETLPASTFKIINSLIALKNQAVKNEHEVVKWDGKVRGFQGQPVDAWNQDTNLKEAYRNSTVWFYVEMAKRIGREKYRTILKESGYGNNDLKETGTDFWNYGPFAISPQNQITFLVDLYENKLPFSEGQLKVVKEIMVSERKNGYTIRSKTGWTQKDGKDIGWWIGFIEKHNEAYFFATRITKSKSVERADFGSLREKITRNILTGLGILDER